MNGGAGEEFEKGFGEITKLVLNMQVGFGVCG
jgi:hypothetical protein